MSEAVDKLPQFTHSIGIDWFSRLVWSPKVFARYSNILSARGLAESNSSDSPWVSLPVSPREPFGASCPGFSRAELAPKARSRAELAPKARGVQVVAAVSRSEWGLG